MDNQNTTLRIDRLDGERLVLDGLGLARGFFSGDPSSIGTGSYDSLAGRGERNRITTADVETINRTMRARSGHQWWEPLLDRELDWLSALDPALDLIAATGNEWKTARGERLATEALAAAIGSHRGPSVATKVLHLKRPRLFPVLDSFVAVMLGKNMPDNATDVQRIKTATELLLHLRIQGRSNLCQLQTIQTMLEAEGIQRSLVRILDAIIWFAHPAAGVPNTTREMKVTASKP